MVGLDSDISAPLLIDHLRKYYKIPDTWTHEEARAVIGIRYEMDSEMNRQTHMVRWIAVPVCHYTDFGRCCAGAGHA